MPPPMESSLPLKAAPSWVRLCNGVDVAPFLESNSRKIHPSALVLRPGWDRSHECAHTGWAAVREGACLAEGRMCKVPGGRRLVGSKG